jgi:hypothetical protein
VTCWYHSTPSKLCDACMREQAKAAPAVPAWADMGDAAEVHSSAAIDFAMLDFSGDAKWEQRAAEFTAEKRAEKLAAVEALCGFAAKLSAGERTTGTPWVDGHSGPLEHMVGPPRSDYAYLGKIPYPSLDALEREISDATDALRYALDNPGPDAKPFHQVMADWLPSKTPGATFFGVERSKPTQLSAEAFLAALLRDPPEPQPMYFSPRDYETLRQSVEAEMADQVAASMYAPTAPAGQATPLKREDMEYHETFRLGARGCHVGATVRHRGDPAGGLMKVTAINGAVDRVCCVDANGDKREFGLSSGWLVLVNAPGDWFGDWLGWREKDACQQAMGIEPGRRTGRTTRLLEHAIGLAKKGKDVVFMVHTGWMVEEAIRMLREGFDVDIRSPAGVEFAVFDRTPISFTEPVGNLPPASTFRTGRLRVDVFSKDWGRGRKPGDVTPVLDHAVLDQMAAERLR